MKQADNWQDRLAALRSVLGEPEEETEEQMPEAAAPSTESARLDIVLEKKGRAGKVATIVTGFTMPDSEIDKLASDLKRTLGTGGSARGGEILIQGDRRSDVLRVLKAKGLKARII